MIVDVETTTAIRQGEVIAAKRMLDRVEERHKLYPARLAADTGYGSGPMLEWLVEDKGIEPHIPVFDKGERKDGTFSRSDFTFEHDTNQYICPAGKPLRQFNRQSKKQRSGVTKAGFRNYRAKKSDCDICPLKEKCCPTQPHRKILRSIHEGARDMARDIANMPQVFERSFSTQSARNRHIAALLMRLKQNV